MKTITSLTTKTVFLFVMFLTLFSAKAQAPQKMSYQAVIRNASNTLISNTVVGIRISVLQTTASGSAVFVERQTPTTNINGLASIEIGAGTLLSGNFATINWANGPYFIKTETDPVGGTNYTISGTSQLLSVPFALFAASGNPGPQGIQGLTGATGAQGIQGLTVRKTVPQIDRAWHLCSLSRCIFKSGPWRNIQTASTDQAVWNRHTRDLQVFILELDKE